jgi:aspartyl protease family protein
VTRSVGFWLLILVGATVALVFVLNELYPGALDDPESRFYLLTRIGWVALIGSSVIGAARFDPKTALRQAAVWLAIFLGLVGVYSFKNDAAYIGQRFMGALSPTQGVAHDDGTLSFDAGPDGHFYIQALVNGGRVTFMVDTGATDVVLAPDDARRIAETANGTVSGAAIRLDSLAIGSIAMNRLPATVNGADMSDSLLGMEFLNRLHGWRVENGVLTLVP